MSASRIVDGSPPVATARTVMSRSVTMPQGLSCSITTTVPIRRSLIALAASATDASELIATGSLVMTSRTVVAIEHLQRRDVRYEKNARAARAYPRREEVAASRTLNRRVRSFGVAKPARYSICPARYPSGGAWPAMAEPSTVFWPLKRLRRFDQPREQAAGRDADHTAHRDVARKVMAQVDARNAHSGREREDEGGDLRIKSRHRRRRGERRGAVAGRK